MKKILFIATLLTLNSFGMEQRKGSVAGMAQDLKIQTSQQWESFDKIKTQLASSEQLVATVALHQLNDPRPQQLKKQCEEKLIKQGLELIGSEAAIKMTQSMLQRQDYRQILSSYSHGIECLITTLYPLLQQAVEKNVIQGSSAQNHTFEKFLETHAANILPYIHSLKPGNYQLAPDAELNPALKAWVDSETQYFKQLLGITSDLLVLNRAKDKLDDLLKGK